MVCGQRTPPSWTIDFNFFWLMHPTYSSFFWCIETGWFVRLNFWWKKGQNKTLFWKKESFKTAQKDFDDDFEWKLKYSMIILEQFWCSSKTFQIWIQPPLMQILLIFWQWHKTIFLLFYFIADFGNSIVLLPLLPLFSLLRCHFMYWQNFFLLLTLDLRRAPTVNSEAMHSLCCYDYNKS